MPWKRMLAYITGSDKEGRATGRDAQILLSQGSMKKAMAKVRYSGMSFECCDLVCPFS